MHSRSLSMLLGLFFLSALTSCTHNHAVPHRGNESRDFSDLQVANARQGQTVPLTQLFCELNFGNGTVKSMAIPKIGQVGGGFAVSLLSPLLDDKLQNTASPGSAGNDVNLPLQVQSLRALPSAVPDPPLPKEHQVSLQSYSRELEIWRTWLKANHDSLINLSPRPIDEISAKECKQVLRDDFAARQYPNTKPSRGGRPQ